MARQLLKTTLSIITLAACAQTALAASPNQNNGGGGSHCPPGTIGVLDNGVWDCVEQTIQSQGGATMSTATMGAKKYTPSKPPRAKPDLTVALDHMSVEAAVRVILDALEERAQFSLE